MELIKHKKTSFLPEQVFSYSGNTVRVILDELGNPWWVAKDVCNVLGIVNHHQALRSLDPDERGMYKVYTPKGPQFLKCVNESGLYSLILSSKKPEAKPFKKWVTADVLPTIRKTGRYVVDTRIARDESSMRFKFMCDALAEMRSSAGKTTEQHHYSNEARLINLVAFGSYNPEARDSLTKPEIKRINRIQARNIILIYQGISYKERKAMLLEIFPILISEQTVSGVDQKTEILIA